jgi:hypothetical protein
MPNFLYTYSFKDIVGVFTNTVLPPFPLGGEAGLDKIEVEMSRDRVNLKVAADAGMMMSYLAGANGTMLVTCQETSPLDAYLVNYVDIIYSQADKANLLNFAAGQWLISDIINARSHRAVGAIPLKIPNRPYEGEGQNVTWTFICAQITNEALLP